MSFTEHLRPYQLTAVDAVFREWETVNATLLDQATGTGKTVEIAEVVRRAQPRRALVLAHRRVLVHQAHHKIEKFSGLNAEIEMAMERASYNLFNKCHAVVSSVQSQTPGRRSRPEDFDLLIIDEAHHLKPGNRSYMEVIEHYRKNPRLKILGVTATVEPACMKFFQSVAFSYPILNAINDGYLVNIEQQMVSVHGLDYSHIRTTAGDLNGADLAAVVEREKICQGMTMGTLEVMFGLEPHTLTNVPVEGWGDYLFSNGSPKRNLVFTVSVAQAKMMSDIFNRVKPGMSAWVCGDTNLVTDEQRQKIGRDFNKGDIQIVCNCGVYSEGYDNPGIEMVTMARPTKSKTLFTQQVGRGTRTLEGTIDGIATVEDRIAAIAASAKTKLLVLDFVGNCGRHKLISSVDLLGQEMPEEVKERARRIVEKSSKPRNMTEVLNESREELKQEREDREREEIARKQRLVAKSTYSLSKISAFDRFQVRHQKPTAWDQENGRILSPRQRATLVRMGVNPDDVSFSCGKQLIGAHFNQPATSGQSGLLRRKGYSTEEIAGLTITTARNEIEKLKANGWERPTNGEKKPQEQTKHVPYFTKPDDPELPF